MSPAAAPHKTPAGKRRRKMPATPVVTTTSAETKEDTVAEATPSTPPPPSSSGISPVGRRTRSAVKKKLVSSTPAKKTPAKKAASTPAKKTASTPAAKSTVKKVKKSSIPGIQEEEATEEKEEKVPSTPAAKTRTTKTPAKSTAKKGRKTKEEEEPAEKQKEDKDETEKKEEKIPSTPTVKTTRGRPPKTPAKSAAKKGQKETKEEEKLVEKQVDEKEEKVPSTPATATRARRSTRSSAKFQQSTTAATTVVESATKKTRAEPPQPKSAKKTTKIDKDEKNDDQTKVASAAVSHEKKKDADAEIETETATTPAKSTKTPETKKLDPEKEQDKTKSVEKGKEDHVSAARKAAATTTTTPPPPSTGKKKKRKTRSRSMSDASITTEKKQDDISKKEKLGTKQEDTKKDDKKESNTKKSLTEKSSSPKKVETKENKVEETKDSSKNDDGPPKNENKESTNKKKTKTAQAPSTPASAESKKKQRQPPKSVKKQLEEKDEKVDNVTDSKSSEAKKTPEKKKTDKDAATTPPPTKKEKTPVTAATSSSGKKKRRRSRGRSMSDVSTTEQQKQQQHDGNDKKKESLDDKKEVVPEQKSQQEEKKTSSTTKDSSFSTPKKTGKEKAEPATTPATDGKTRQQKKKQPKKEVASDAAAAPGQKQEGKEGKKTTAMVSPLSIVVDPQNKQKKDLTAELTKLQERNNALVKKQQTTPKKETKDEKTTKKQEDEKTKDDEKTKTTSTSAENKLQRVLSTPRTTHANKNEKRKHSSHSPPPEGKRQGSELKTGKDNGMMKKKQRNDEKTKTMSDKKKKDNKFISPPPSKHKAQRSPSTPRTHETKNKKRKHSFDSQSEQRRQQHQQHNKHHLQQSKKKKMRQQKPKDEPPSKIISVKVHRLRNFNIIPQGILRFATAPELPLKKKDERRDLNNYVAVSRADGSVQLLSVDERWRNKAFIPGLKDRNVDCLAWTSSSSGPVPQRKLYGASGDGTIFECDFYRRQQTNVIGSGGGGVFALVSLGIYLAAGCEDGSVRIYRTMMEDGTEQEDEKGRLELVSTLPSAGQAVLSIAWFRPLGRGGDGIGGTILFAGVADGTIRRYDCIVDRQDLSSGRTRWRPTLRITLENRGKRTPTRIWCMEALKDGTIVSGDSLGLVQFWDGRSGTLLQKIEQNAQGADVLDLAVSNNQTKIFASGVDPLVCCMERVPVASTDQASSFSSSTTEWVNTSGWRFHTHDVRGLAIVRMTGTSNTAGVLAEDPSKSRELLVSGGTDTKLCTYNLSTFKEHRPKKIFDWSFNSYPISLSREKRVLATMRHDKIDLYQLGNSSGAMPTHESPILMNDDEGRIGSIAIEGPYNLACCTISEDGSYLAASDATSLILFHLTYLADGGDGKAAVVPQRIKLSQKDNRSCTALRFASDGSLRLFCATCDGKIVVMRIHNSIPSHKEDASMDLDNLDLNATAEHIFDIPLGGGSGFVPVTHLEISPDSRWLAAGRTAMGSGAVHVFGLKCEPGVAPRESSANGKGGHSLSSYQHWWSVPATEAPTTCLRFVGGGKGKQLDAAALVVVCSSNSFYIFDVERRCMSDWSLDAGLPSCNSLPTELKSRPECIERLAFNPSSTTKFLLAGSGFFCVVDLDRPVPDHSDIYPPNHVRASKFTQGKLASSNRVNARKNDKRVQKIVQKKGYSNMTLCLQYNGMIFLDFVDDDEMVVVEQPWLSVVNSLPDALERKVYGK